MSAAVVVVVLGVVVLLEAVVGAADGVTVTVVVRGVTGWSLAPQPASANTVAAAARTGSP